MLRFALFLVGVALLGFVALAWLDPERQPAGIVGLQPSFQEVDDRYDAALAAARPDEALEWVDEFLLSAGAGGPRARRAWDLRDAARLQGATFHGMPADRGQAWRLKRVWSRRPLWETALGTSGSVLIVAALLAALFTRKERDDGPILPPPEHIERVYGGP